MTRKALEQAERKIVELESILNSKEEMIEDLLTTIKEKDSKIRREEQEHVQIQNDLLIKNVKLLQEREENMKIISERSKQIDEYKYYVTELRQGSDIVSLKWNKFFDFDPSSTYFMFKNKKVKISDFIFRNVNFFHFSNVHSPTLCQCKDGQIEERDPCQRGQTDR